ncbi:MAG: hypothetical protein FJ033_09690 [Chloroflexi bacterium]|nr:hypothetical protein [Chloroflexota bacterium]
MESEVPTCPQCGSAMVVRTARQGQNAGSQFYGCSRYPTCRGTRPYVLTIDEPDSPIDHGPGRAVPATSFARSPGAVPDMAPIPVEIVARERHPRYQFRFFQVCALPQTMVEALRFEVEHRNVVRSFAQWRLASRSGASISRARARIDRLSRGLLPPSSPSRSRYSCAGLRRSVCGIWRPGWIRIPSYPSATQSVSRPCSMPCARPHCAPRQRSCRSNRSSTAVRNVSSGIASSPSHRVLAGV